MGKDRRGSVPAHDILLHCPGFFSLRAAMGYCTEQGAGTHTRAHTHACTCTSQGRCKGFCELSVRLTRAKYSDCLQRTKQGLHSQLLSKTGDVLHFLYILSSSVLSLLEALQIFQFITNNIKIPLHLLLLITKFSVLTAYVPGAGLSDSRAFCALICAQPCEITTIVVLLALSFPRHRTEA